MSALKTVASPTPCIECPFLTTSVCRVLGDGDPKRVESKRRRQLSVRPKRILTHEGETSGEVFILQAGWSARFRVLANGDRQILKFDLPGDFLSPELLFREPARFSKIALTGSTFCAFPVDVVSGDIFSTQENASFINRMMARHIRDADDRILMLGRMPASGRVAGLMLDFHRRLSRRGMVFGNAFEFPLRHEDIGDALGLTAAHVSRTLAVLRQEGLVDLREGRALVIPQELAHLAH